MKTSKIEKLSNQIASLEDQHKNSTGREVYAIGRKLRAKKQKLSDFLSQIQQSHCY